MVVIGSPVIFPVWRILETTVAGIGSGGTANAVLYAGAVCIKELVGVQLNYQVNRKGVTKIDTSVLNEERNRPKVGGAPLAFPVPSFCRRRATGLAGSDRCDARMPRSR